MYKADANCISTPSVSEPFPGYSKLLHWTQWEREKITLKSRFTWKDVHCSTMPSLLMWYTFTKENINGYLICLFSYLNPSTLSKEGTAVSGCSVMIDNTSCKTSRIFSSCNTTRISQFRYLVKFCEPVHDLINVRC